MDHRLADVINDRPREDYIAPFFWLHEEDDALIVRELEKIYEAGIRAVCLESRTHEHFAEDGWWSDCRLIMEECKKRGMHVWILDDKHFPSGYADGAFLNLPEDKRKWDLVEGHMDVSGPVTDGAALVSPWLNPGDVLIAVSACRHKRGTEEYDTVLDLTDNVHDGMVYFTLPEGDWRIVFVAKSHSSTPEYRHAYCDMLDPASTQKMIDCVYEPHYAHLKEYFGNVFLGFFSDEPGFTNGPWQFVKMGDSTVCHPWHDTVFAALKKQFGTDIPKMLAGLWLNVDGVSESIRCAFMEIITREYEKNFCVKLGDWCRDHGVSYIGHIIEDNNAHACTGLSAGHYFRALSGQDMAGIDVVLHQILPGLTECSSAGWVSYRHMENEFFHYELAKLASSMAKVQENKHGRAMCEIFGAFGWAEGTKTMKYLTDHMLVRGINYFVPHAFSPKENDPDCPPTFYDAGQNPEYPYFKVLMGYMDRCCHVLSGGERQVSCALLYDAESRWINRGFLPLQTVAKALYDHQLDYDILPADDLTLAEKDGLLLIPDADSLPEAVIEKICHLTVPAVVVSRDGTTKLPFPAIPLEKTAEFVAASGLRDVETAHEEKLLRFLHISRNGAEIYMFSSEEIHQTLAASVRVKAFAGGRYLVYDAMENRLTEAFSENGEITLVLPPYHALILFFGENEPCKTEKTHELPLTWQTITPHFAVEIAEENGDFRPYTETDTLFNVTGPGRLPHFSGHIRYTAAVTLNGTEKQLDLGYAGEIAEVEINGQLAGVRIVPPYVFDLNGLISPGTNTVTVTVTNHNGFVRRDGMSKFMLFEPSGLLGPIKIGQ